MLGRADGEGDQVADRLVEARIGALAVGRRLIGVVHVVLNVAHLVVDGDEVVEGPLSALLYAVVGFGGVVEVPGGGVAAVGVESLV